MIPADEIEYYLGLFDGVALPDVLQIVAHAEFKTLRAEDIYIHKGALNTKLSLIRHGLIRVYQPECSQTSHPDPALPITNPDSQKEITVMLRWEKQFIASVDGILYQRASRFVYQAIEDTTLMEVDYAAVQSIIDNNPRLSSARNFFLMQILGQAMERIESFVLLTPEQRYQKLVDEKPGIFNRVPNKYLATLLGITPVSLSRIRRRIASQRHR